MSCVQCGSTVNLQEHHISYDPPNVITLCVDCHTKLHNHYVGRPRQKTSTKPSSAYFHDGKVWSPIWKGSFTPVPLAIRRLLHLEPGDKLAWYLENEELIVCKKGYITNQTVSVKKKESE